MNLYYAIVGDAIGSVRRGHSSSIWKGATFMGLTLCLYFNILTLSMATQLFVGYNTITKIEQCLLPLPNGYSHVVTIVIPCMCIIYFLVFYKKKYIYIYRKYKYRNGKLFLIYFFGSMLLFMGIALLRDYFFKVGAFR